MKRLLFGLTLLSVLGISQTTTTMPSRTTLAGLTFLTGAGLIATRNAEALSDKIVSLAKSVTSSLTNSAQHDPHFDKKVGLGLAGIGAMMLIPYERILPEKETILSGASFGVEALGVLIGLVEIGKEVHSYCQSTNTTGKHIRRKRY